MSDNTNKTPEQEIKEIIYKTRWAGEFNENTWESDDSSIFLREQTLPELIKLFRERDALIVKMQEALTKAKDLIVSEYCSHKWPHSADEKECYANFIYSVLTTPK